MSALISGAAPVAGPEHDRSNPQPWMDFRASGITASAIKTLVKGGVARRDLISTLAEGGTQSLRGISPALDDALDWGIAREPMINDWIVATLGTEDRDVQPTSIAFHHPDNPRHIASPDGYTVDPFSREMLVGTHDALTVEVKTTRYDLTPGPIDAARVLHDVQQDSQFDRLGYYYQTQWQCYVMNAASTLFVWEQHDGRKDPETGTFTPTGPPQWCIIPRNQAVIDFLVEVADKALAEIDALQGVYDEVEEWVAEVDPDEVPLDVLVRELREAREAVNEAGARRDAAFAALQERYLGGDDLSFEEAGAKITVSTTTRMVKKFDADRARARAPKFWEDYDKRVAQFTTTTPESKQGLTVTFPKV